MKSKQILLLDSDQKSHCSAKISFYLHHFFWLANKMPTMIITKYSSVLSHYLLPGRRCNSSIEEVAAEDCHWVLALVKETAVWGAKTLRFTLRLWPWDDGQLKTSRSPLILHSLICTMIIMRTGWDNLWNTNNISIQIIK